MILLVAAPEPVHKKARGSMQPSASVSFVSGAKRVLRGGPLLGHVVLSVPRDDKFGRARGRRREI